MLRGLGHWFSKVSTVSFPQKKYEYLRVTLIILFLNSTNSCDIMTPDDYSLLLKGKIGSNCDNLMIHESANSEVLSLPVQFANASYDVVTFSSGRLAQLRNTIYIRPYERYAKGLFNSGKVLLRGLPLNYTTYKLVYAEDAALSVGDFKAILQWTYAKKLTIFDERQHDIANKLSRNLYELSQMSSLEDISLILHKRTLEKINIKGFLAELPALKQARFILSAHISKETSISFLETLKMPKTWAFDIDQQTYPGVISIVCTKGK